MRFVTVLASLAILAVPALAADPPAGLIRSAKSGSWSAAATWEGGKVPAAGARVQVREGHAVVYDVKSDAVIRSIHVAGTLSFARDRDTLLTVGLIKIQPGSDASEEGFDCEAHVMELQPGQARPALEVGTAEQPIANHVALIRLALVEGLDPKSCPAIKSWAVACRSCSIPISGREAATTERARATSSVASLA